MLTAGQRLGSDAGYRSHTLHVEPDGAFSITALVWRPGQLTRIHDHLTWCVFGVIQGVEYEELYDAGLNLIGGDASDVLFEVHGNASIGGGTDWFGTLFSPIAGKTVTFGSNSVVTGAVYGQVIEIGGGSRLIRRRPTSR